MHKTTIRCSQNGQTKATQVTLSHAIDMLHQLDRCAAFEWGRKLHWFKNTSCPLLSTADPQPAQQHAPSMCQSVMGLMGCEGECLGMIDRLNDERPGFERRSDTFCCCSCCRSVMSSRYDMSRRMPKVTCEGMGTPKTVSQVHFRLSTRCIIQERPA